MTMTTECTHKPVLALAPLAVVAAARP